MKTIIAQVAALFLLFALPLSGQDRSIEITPMIGYHFTSRIDFVEGDFKIPARFSYGAILGLEVANDLYAEFHYTRSGMEGKFFPLGVGLFEIPYDMSMNYFMLGAMKQFDSGGEGIPFITLALGTTSFSPKDDNLKSTWTFTAGIGGGVKFGIGEKVDLRMQGRILTPFFFSGGTFFECKEPLPNTNCSFVIPSGQVLFGVDLSLGVMVRIN